MGLQTLILPGVVQIKSADQVSNIRGGRREMLILIREKQYGSQVKW